MKKIYAMMGSFLLLFMLYSCSEENVFSTPGGPEEPKEPKLKLELQFAKVNLPCLGGSVSVEVSTNQEKWTAVSTNKDWLTLKTEGNKITLIADNANMTDHQLTSVVTVTAGVDGKTVTKELNVYQNTSAMIFEYTVPEMSMVRLPIYGKVDCTIDWGDGSVETCKEENIDNFMTAGPAHTYRTAGIYKVSIVGKVAALNSILGFSAEMSSYMTRVIQWGNVGLVSLNNAFSYYPNLWSIADDDDKAFSEVLTFSHAFYTTNLQEIPEGLFRYATKATNFDSAFSYTAITNIPTKLLENCTSAQNVSSLFSYTNIRAIPEELFRNNPKITNFGGCFTKCQFLRSIPEKLFHNNPLADDFSYIFRDCGGLTSIPENLFSKSPNASNMVGLFTFCYSLTTVPGKLFANNPRAYKFTYAFANCSSLKSIPVELFDNCKDVLSFQGAMRECLSITGETPYTMIDGVKVHLYERSKYPAHFTTPETGEKCFQNSTGFSDYQTIATQYPVWVR